MACSKCNQQRKKLGKAITDGDGKKAVKVAIEGVRMMVGLEAGQLKMFPTKKNK